jgi:signal transduction histidine kinase
MASGNLDERLSSLRKDEIGELAASFNTMADSIQDKMDALILNARQKEDFVASFAHELKTPLTSVIGYADMLYQKELPPGQVKRAAWYILSEGLRLEALSIKLMDMIVLNRQDFVLVEMSADELLQDVTAGLTPLLGEKNVDLRIIAAPAMIKVEYDLFKTLLLNLIDNSIKADCTQVLLSGKAGAGYYRISVADNGRGIVASELERITEAFYMVDKSRSHKQHGAGLGLALAAKIAEIHGSQLEFVSEPGKGTEVAINLAGERSDAG